MHNCILLKCRNFYKGLVKYILCKLLTSSTHFDAAVYRHSGVDERRKKIVERLIVKIFKSLNITHILRTTVIHVQQFRVIASRKC